LLVDDDKDIAEMFRKGLALKGFQVEALTDPQLLLEKFEPGKHDILITDLRMPGINGIELYEKIIKMDNKIKVFFLSAYEIHEKETKISLGLSPNSFIRKPISIENLANLIVS
jgi:two-component system, NtrC family, response regulator GlrR